MLRAATDELTYATHYRTVQLDGLEIFYREAGRADAPTILLLHGFPTSSHMFRDLIPLLSDRYHLVAPDYPGFGNSSTPRVTNFGYTFDHLTDVIERFTDAIGLNHYSLYLQDFGGPVGFRLATRRPQQIRTLIIQNANAYAQGLSDGLRAELIQLHRERTPVMKKKALELFELPYTLKQYLHGEPDLSLVSPDAWQHAQWGMDRPHNKDIQYELHADYASNFDRYEEWHAFFRKNQPPTLIVWGGGDFVFGVHGAEGYREDLAQIEVHLLNAGHFALETNAPEIAQHMRAFLGRFDAVG